MPHRLSLAQMAVQIRARRLSPVELVEAHLRQIEKHNPSINAFVRVLGEEALDAAKHAEAAAVGEPTGPLHGIPVTIKDSFDMEGLPTTRGSRLFMQHRAARDATSVARLRSAGAIPIGKTSATKRHGSMLSGNFVRHPVGGGGRESNPPATILAAKPVLKTGGATGPLPPPPLFIRYLQRPAQSQARQSAHLLPTIFENGNSVQPSSWWSQCLRASFAKRAFTAGEDLRSCDRPDPSG